MGRRVVVYRKIQENPRRGASVRSRAGPFAEGRAAGARGSLELANEHPLAAAIVEGAHSRGVTLRSLTGMAITGTVDGPSSAAPPGRRSLPLPLMWKLHATAPENLGAVAVETEVYLADLAMLAYWLAMTLSSLYWSL